MMESALYYMKNIYLNKFTFKYIEVYFKLYYNNNK